MDILNILEQLKQKGLDVVQVELLKSAYELQNRNLEQLKENNDALRESNQLLKERILALENQNVTLRDQIKYIPSQKPSDEISDTAKDVLKAIADADTTEFNSEAMINHCSKKYTRIQVEAGMGELLKKRLIMQSAFMTYDKGVKYRLTQSGKEYCAAL